MKTNNMVGILYFSSTGNSLYIAKKAQSRTGGSIKYIPTYNGDGSEFDKIVLVTPIYSFGMPTFVYDIIPRLNKESEIFIIQNYSGMIASGNGVRTHFCGNKSVFAVLNSLIVLSTISVVCLAKTYAAKRRFLFHKNASRRKERIFR